MSGDCSGVAPIYTLPRQSPDLMDHRYKQCILETHLISQDLTREGGFVWALPVPLLLVAWAVRRRWAGGTWWLSSSSLLSSPSSKSTPGRNHFSPSERNAVHPNTASKNNLPPEQFLHQLRIWPNTYFFSFLFLKWNLLQLHYSRHCFECKQHCWAITWQLGRKRAKNKSETKYIDYGGWPKSNEKEHWAAGSGQKRRGFPHSAYSCQPVLVSAVYNL